MITSEMPVSRTRLVEMVEDSLLHGHVESAGWLVGDDQLRLASQRDRDEHALTKAARQLVRVLPGAQFSVGDSGLFEQRDHFRVDRHRRVRRAAAPLRRSGYRPAASG